MARKKVSNFDILRLIEQKLSISEMAFKLGITKGAISQRIKKLQDKRLIELDIEETFVKRSQTLSDIKIFRLTEKGKREIYNFLRGDEAEMVIPHVRGVHNVQFKFQIKKKGDFLFPYKAVLKNWIKKYTWFGDVYVEMNGKENNPSSLVIKFSLEESNPWKAAYKALVTALKMKRILEDRAGFDLEDPEMIGKPKWEILGDPVAKKVSEKQVVVGEHGAIDNTPVPGTMHYYDPDDVMAYLNMARKIQNIEKKIDNFPQIATYIAETVTEKVAIEVSKSVTNALLNSSKHHLNHEDNLEDMKGYA